MSSGGASTAAAAAAAAHASAHQEVRVTTGDGADVAVPQAVVDMSTTIRNIVEDGESGVAIPLPNITAAVLERVVAFCEKYPMCTSTSTSASANDGDGNDDNDTDLEQKRRTAYYDEYCGTLDQTMLFDVILAANYLDVKELLDATCRVVANMIAGKTPEEIRKQFDIKNDFTPEEEEAVRREHEWVEST